MTNWPALAPELTGLPDAIDPGQFTDAPDHFGLAYTQGHAATVMVAASDTPADLKRLAQQKYRCDGVADQVQIQAALDDSDAKAVVLLPGTFTVDAPIVFKEDGQTIEGSGKQITFVAASASFTGSGVFMDQSPNWDFVGLRDMTIAVGSNCNDGVELNGDGVTLERLRITAPSRYGVHVSGGNDAMVVQCDVINSGDDGFFDLGTYTTFIGCYAENSTNRGFYMFGYWGRLISCQARNCGSTGDNSAFYSSGGYMFVGCIAESSDGVGFYLSGFDQATGCLVATAGEHGVWMAGSDALLSDCLIQDVSDTTHNTYDAIHITGDRNSVHGCKTWDPASGNRARYSCRIESTGDHNYIFGNDFSNSGITGQLSDAGTNTDTTSTNKV